MNSYFKKASWIWISEDDKPDEYGEFFGEVNYSGKKTLCRISCDGDYTLYVNGSFVESNQYGDFEHYKVFDEIDITKHLHKGSNEIRILVWHFGVDSQRYICNKAGVIFEIYAAGEILLASGNNVMCRRNVAYLNGYCKKITGQLGLSFLYNATKENVGEFYPSVIVKKVCNFYPRPTKKLVVSSRAKSKVLIARGNYYLVDLGKETVGLPSIDFVSEKEQKIVVAWGEDLTEGHVRRIIGNRDFSFEYVAKKGNNSYTNYMLRLGCRYLELFAEDNIKLNYLGVLPQSYPVDVKVRNFEREDDAKIYDLCVRTLKLSMMEHYVDTPWREQCLYAFDSRNQMLCGYRAFENGNREYARANLVLIGKDKRDDGLLSICYPSGFDLAIPSFSLYYFMEVREYLDYTGDISLIEEIYDKLISVIEVFLNNRRDGLVFRFSGANHWNFYDWSDYSDGCLSKSEKDNPDLYINALFILALENLKVISNKANKPFPYEEIIEETRAFAREAFYDKEVGAFSVAREEKQFTSLGNAFAILSGIAQNPSELCRRIASGEFVSPSLSMKCFVYDALLKSDSKWKSYVINEIRGDYSLMLNSGATSVWETIEGARAFDNAGSLCHGWSAVPVLYL